jgi:hypothetical protein
MAKASLSLLALAGLLALVVSAGASGRRPADAYTADTAGFVISGSARGLYPGARRTLVIRVGNRKPVAIRVVSLRVNVLAARNGCAAANVRVGRFRRTLTVRARGSGFLVLPISMLRRAPDSCQGAVFPLVFTGKAVGG